MWRTTSNTLFEWQVENIFIFHTKLKIKSYSFKKTNVEVLELLIIIFNPNYEFFDSSCCVTTQILLSNQCSPPLYWIMTFASKHVKCPTSMKLVSGSWWHYVLKPPLLQITILDGMTSVFFAKVSCNVANWYTTCWCPCKIAIPHIMICFHIHASKSRGVHSLLYFAYTCLRDLFIVG